VDVLGVGEVGKKEKHAAQCPPEAEDAEGIGVGGSEEMGDCGSKGLEGVGAFGGDTGSGSDGAAADVEENKGGDDQRVNGDFGAEDVGMKERAVVKAKVASTGKGEAAKDQGDNTKQDEETQDVGQQVVDCADGVGRGDGDWEITLKGVDEVDEPVKDEAVEDEGVEEADSGAFFEGALLGKRCDEGVPDASREIVETEFGVRSAPADTEVEAAETFGAKREGDEREEEKGDLLGKWKHGRHARVRSYVLRSYAIIFSTQQGWPARVEGRHRRCHSRRF